ncbi:NAD(P)/FAD-dependent oxidoreductase [Aquabacterium sp. A7-Y]|uniref:NAD(P)/FAD-dependent oxidoreductase n=1 Tax=Aquabacterium sp. A7-Y TaxID=1349605 RepID=UPI00223DEDA6|nr:NAD(P)/FAD-dependent oxidoreductase [Aquabacterium sp. A7-Y]MCW7537499.1 NAD(P)/FAD-dependent oxidoreductase [Aquabacterium sp. A7-Y]
MEQVDAVVVGAGVVGLAVGRALARRGLETVVLEGATAVGTGTSSRNSEVIHAGLYYPAGSWKARLCVAGKEMLYRYCAERGVEHRRCGKLVVASSEGQLPELQQLIRRAAANGVTDLRLLDAAEAIRLEPALACVGAVLSPSTGIVDSHGLMLALQGDLEAAGGALALASPVERVCATAAGLVLEVGGDTGMTLQTRLLVNAAGLWAPALAGRIEGLDPALVPRAYFAKGNYYALSGRAPFSRLVYPVPEAAGLGVHLTLDLGGQARFGPDVEWLTPDEDGALDYRVDPARAEGFYAEIRRYWPELPEGALQPAYSGIRPKIQAPGEPARDFVIQGPAEHGIAGLVNLFGIESPGLTASLALGEAAAGLASAT